MAIEILVGTEVRIRAYPDVPHVVEKIEKIYTLRVVSGFPGSGGETVQVPESQVYKLYWRIVWTTAPVDYDYSYAKTEREYVCDKYRAGQTGRIWRQVRIESFKDDEHLKYIVGYQSERYQSGMHAVYATYAEFQHATGIEL